MRNVQSADCEGAIVGGDAVSEAWACVREEATEPMVCAAGGATVELVVGTSICEPGAVLSDEILQQVELCDCACASALVPSAWTIIGQSGAHECFAV
jgi:hypothetical protein